MDRARSAQRGFTIIEVSVVVTVMALALMLFTRNFVRAQDFAEHERARMRNLVEQQENLRTLESILQAVDITSLGGLQDDGSATVPTFRRWLHDPTDGVTLGPDEKIEWRAAGDAVGDVRNPGRLYLVRGTDATVLADRVPKGGFQVRVDGRRLLIHLHTYYETTSNNAVRNATRTAVFLGRGDE